MFCTALTRKPETCQNTFWRKAYISSGKKKRIIWPRSEINPFFFLEGGYWYMAMLDFLWHLRTFLGLITRLCVIYCVVLHPTVVTSSRPHPINFSLLRMKALPFRDLLPVSPCTGRARRGLPWEGCSCCASEVTPGSSVTRKAPKT